MQTTNRISIGFNFVLCLLIAAGTASARVRQPETAARQEFRHIQQQIAKFRGYRRHSQVNSQAFNDAACIPDNDRCPTRITLKRITALTMHLSQMPNAPDLSQEKIELAELVIELRQFKARGCTQK